LSEDCPGFPPKKNYKIFHLHIDIFLTKVYNANSEIVN